MDSDNEKRQVEKARKMYAYREIWQMPGFQDLLNYLQTEQTNLWNEILREQDYRRNKLPTDTLRGQAQMIIQINDYLRKIFDQGQRAEQALAEKSKTGNM